MATASEIKSFIQRLGALAVAESNRRIAAGKGFVLPSVCIAQSAIETGWGTAGIMVKANAFFGIKAGGSWTGAVYRADTWEVDSGGAYNTTANFRAYPSLEASVADYYDLIGNNKRYAAALSFGKDRSQWLTPKACITAIWSGGYATDTLYVEKIMSTINARDLADFDMLITGEGTAPTMQPDVAYTFTKADLVQGSLIVTDSGRSIQNDRTITTAVALDWSKAIDASADMFFVSGYGDYKIKVAYINSDTAAIAPIVPMTGQAPMGDFIGFYMENADGSELSLTDLDDDLAIVFETHRLPDGGVTRPLTLAFFVKVDG